MTFAKKVELDSVILFFLAAAAGITFAMFFHNNAKHPISYSLPVIAQFEVSPTPSPILKPQVQTVSEVSSDGTKKITLKVTTNANKTKTYTAFVSHIDDTNSQQVFSITYIADSMSIPFNAFSPDNTYVFLQHTTSTETESFAMQANGQPFSDNENYINVTSLFNAKGLTGTYQETTGWASDTLLIINTKAQDGTQGPSYWFDVPSKSIIPLATQF